VNQVNEKKRLDKMKNFMRKYIYGLISLAVVAILISGNFVNEKREIEVALGWSKTSVNAVIFRQNSLVTHEDYQYIAFYDSTGFVNLGKRKIGMGKWENHKTQYDGNVLDAHNSISIMVDGDGFLHMSWDHHGHKLNYSRSLKPGSLVMGEKLSMTGKVERNVTYPQFYKMSNGDLLFVYRDGSSGNGNIVLNHYDLKNKMWQQLHKNLIDGEQERNAYWQMYLDKNDVLHMSWVWRESGDVATNHDMCYARSMDGGMTWQSSEGKEFSIPVNAENAEYAMRIPQKSDLINQTSMTADDNSNPYIATYYQDKNDLAPHVNIIYNTGESWNGLKVGQRTLDFDLSGGGTRSIPISRPIILHSNNSGASKLHVIYRDEEYNDKACLKTLELGKGSDWETSILTETGLDRWEPTFDTELWKDRGILNLFVQKVGQGSGEKAVEMPPTMIRVLEIDNL
jgi:hypothetical protein